MFMQTIPNPHYNPKTGETYECRIVRENGEVVSFWFFTENEAWDCRDDALEAGCKNVRVIGAPTRIGGF